MRITPAELTESSHLLMEPFDTLRDHLPTWTLAITALEGVMGFCDPAQRTIWVDVNLTDRERRSTIMHEAIHALRGDLTDDPEAERLVQIESAHRLIPAAALVAVLSTSPHPEDVCDALDVDIDTLRTRMQNLTIDDASRVRRALANAAPADEHRAHCALGRWWRFHHLPAPVPCVSNCRSGHFSADVAQTARSPTGTLARRDALTVPRREAVSAASRPPLTTRPITHATAGSAA